ncbi:MAG: hypothetical protein J2P27_01125 [Actinobacteria bacterium]|nr:hypothetical protein [Actinomycetota bacterium]
MSGRHHKASSTARNLAAITASRLRNSTGCGDNSRLGQPSLMTFSAVPDNENHDPRMV